MQTLSATAADSLVERASKAARVAVARAELLDAEERVKHLRAYLQQLEGTQA